jgi:hypothetical protein
MLTRAVLLWRGHPAGAVLGVVMNVVGALYMAALALAGASQARAGISGASWAASPYLELAITSLAACWLLLYKPGNPPWRELGAAEGSRRWKLTAPARPRSDSPP